jgi:hypothetical protein
MSKNDITGDKLVTKPVTKAYEDGFDLIFGKKCIKAGKEEALKNVAEVRLRKNGQKRMSEQMKEGDCV